MVELSFYLLSIAAISMLLLLFRGYSFLKVLIGFSIIIILWGSYLAILDQSEVLKNFEVPPRVPLMIVFPVIIAIILLVNSKFMTGAVQNTPLYVPVVLQSFRIFVELLIYATYLKGIFPQRATFEGLNFDILVGISATFMSIGILKGYLKNRAVLIWNIVAICILSVTVYSFISTYYFTDFADSGLGSKFVEIPYLLLASVLLPIAIFLHAFSIKQILEKRRLVN